MLLNIRGFFLLFIVAFSTICCSQKPYSIQTIAFYNLENLFDIIDDPDKMDELSPIMHIKSNRLKIYKDKLSKLSTVLSKIGDEKNNLPPAIIGVAEVENKKVLEDLIATPPLSDYPYNIVHYESPDQRGIDVALLYNKNIFRPIFSEAVPAKLYKNSKKLYTRDILWVTGYLLDEKIHVLVNHWPSRRGGIKKSNPFRMHVAKRNVDIIKQIHEDEPDAKIITMGDFNDNPNNKSLKKILKTKSNTHKLKKGELYNPFEKMFKDGYNTLVFRSKLFLFDQVFFSDNFITHHKNYTQFRFYKAGIYNPNYMTVQKGKYKGNPKRSFAGNKYLKGYSDHFPVYIYLIKENNSN